MITGATRDYCRGAVTAPYAPAALYTGAVTAPYAPAALYTGAVTAPLHEQ